MAVHNRQACYNLQTVNYYDTIAAHCITQNFLFSLKAKKYARSKSGNAQFEI